MATVYKHGTYGEFAPTIARASTQSDTMAVYVGTAPVNLIRGYAAYVNEPVYLTDLTNTRRRLGYSDDWGTFTLCEAFKAHFDNPIGTNVGPIIAINVLDPNVHKKSSQTTKQLTFANKKAIIEGDTIILDTLALADKVEGTDYSVEYDWTRMQTVITDISASGITDQVQASYNEIDTTSLDKDDIIGGVTESGVYTGLGCVNLIYQELNRIPNIIAAPGWATDSEVYRAMVSAGTDIDGHWNAVAIADIPVEDNDTMAEAISWKNTNAYTNERSKVCWPMGQDVYGNVYHLSTACVWGMLVTDANNGGIPMETPSNKQTFIAKQYFGAESTNRGFTQTQANELNASGITTVCYWGAKWVLWGPHTAAYEFNADNDARSIFDNSIRMMMYTLNSFQQEHASVIDKPMTRALKDTILNREQTKADALAARGALLGQPVVSFEESDNSTADMVEGNFVWAFRGTTTPPFKSGTLKVAYTDEGIDDYIGGE